MDAKYIVHTNTEPTQKARRAHSHVVTKHTETLNAELYNRTGAAELGNMVH